MKKIKQRRRLPLPNNTRLEERHRLISKRLGIPFPENFYLDAEERKHWFYRVGQLLVLEQPEFRMIGRPKESRLKLSNVEQAKKKREQRAKRRRRLSEESGEFDVWKHLIKGLGEPGQK